MARQGLAKMRKLCGKYEVRAWVDNIDPQAHNAPLGGIRVLGTCGGNGARAREALQHLLPCAGCANQVKRIMFMHDACRRVRVSYPRRQEARACTVGKAPGSRH